MPLMLHEGVGWDYHNRTHHRSDGQSQVGPVAWSTVTWPPVSFAEEEQGSGKLRKSDLTGNLMQHLNHRGDLGSPIEADPATEISGVCNFPVYPGSPSKADFSQDLFDCNNGVKGYREGLESDS